MCLNDGSLRKKKNTRCKRSWRCQLDSRQMNVSYITCRNKKTKGKEQNLFLDSGNLKTKAYGHAFTTRSQSTRADILNSPISII